MQVKVCEMEEVALEVVLVVDVRLSFVCRQCWIEFWAPGKKKKRSKQKRERRERDFSRMVDDDDDDVVVVPGCAIATAGRAGLHDGKAPEREKGSRKNQE
ncbi:hypothetical protein BELL_0310g00070 [Botrytis elliptica]|uniref:Uncharacterized protein n=1 Tax=Botrytis elliptica TaxID=278938 RepID=A0A4Z1JYQ8_9HELO|nr:hypothetical protein BELL_0310g00070 [Botrytis elliptica]